MFISEDEAARRIHSGDNLLRRLKRDAPPEPVAEVDIVLDQTQNDPTEPTEDDAVRLAILAGRRHLKTSDQRGGRYPQQGNVPPIFRALIGSAAALGTAAATAHAWGVNPVMAHHYKHGRTSQEKESPGLQEAVDQNTLVVRGQVLEILAATVSEITPEKLENKDAKELSMIARNLSGILSSTKPTVIAPPSNNAQVIVFAPELEKEQTYDTIEVG